MEVVEHFTNADIDGLFETESALPVCHPVSAENAVQSAVRDIMDEDNERDLIDCTISDSGGEEGMECVPQKASLSAYVDAAERMRKELSLLLEEGHNVTKDSKGLDMKNALDLEIDRVTVHRKEHAKQSRINDFFNKV